MKRYLLFALMLFSYRCFSQVSKEFVYSTSRPTIPSLNELLKGTSFRVLKQDSMQKKFIDFIVASGADTVDVGYWVYRDKGGFIYNGSNGSFKAIFNFWRECFNPAEKVDSLFGNTHNQYVIIDVNQDNFIIVKYFGTKSTLQINTSYNHR